MGRSRQQSPRLSEAVPEAVAVMVEEGGPEPATEPATSEAVPEAVAVMVEETEPEPETVPEIAAAEPAIAECAVQAIETAPVMEEAATPASEQIAKAVEEPAPVIVPELAMSTEPAVAEIVAESSTEIVSRPEEATVLTAAVAVAEVVAAPAVAETAAVPAPVTEAAPAVDVASEVAALASAWITEVAVEPVTVEAVIVPSASMLAEGATPNPQLHRPRLLLLRAGRRVAGGCNGRRGGCLRSDSIVAEPASWAEVGPTPVVPAGVPAEDAAATAVAPPDPLHKNLWAAAEMVAEAVSPHAAPSVSVAPAPLPLVAAAPPAPAPAPAPIPQAVPEAMPPFMTRLRRAPDHLQWAVFGGAAAFLGVIWVAIWLAVGK